MRTEDSSIQLCRVCGRFFFGLAALSVILSFFAFRSKEWWSVAKLLGVAFFFGFIGWAAVVNPVSHSQGEGGGEELAGCLVPVSPSPTHHLTAARDLPPSDKTHTFPKD
jgi:hypothetical protein